MICGDYSKTLLQETLEGPGKCVSCNQSLYAMLLTWQALENQPNAFIQTSLNQVSHVTRFDCISCNLSGSKHQCDELKQPKAILGHVVTIGHEHETGFCTSLVPW